MHKKNSDFAAIKSVANLCLCLGLIIFVSLGCGIIKNPIRDYKEKPFNSGDWLKGDSVERGRMFSDLFVSRFLTGKSKDDVIGLLGEPEKKIEVEGTEVWLYRVELAYRTPMQFFPVSFDSKGAFAGRVKGDTMSMLVEDE